jgi:hypothetical protein
VSFTSPARTPRTVTPFPKLLHRTFPSQLALMSLESAQALAATRHLLEMYRRQLADEKTRCKLQRLDKRLLTVAFELDRLPTAQK